MLFRKRLSTLDTGYTQDIQPQDGTKLEIIQVLEEFFFLLFLLIFLFDGQVSFSFKKMFLHLSF